MTTQKMTRKVAAGYGIWLSASHGTVRAVLNGERLAESANVTLCLSKLAHHGAIADGIARVMRALCGAAS